MTRRLSFWIVAATFGLFLFAASAPSPLYAVYAAKWQFSAVALTEVFAVYAIALLIAALSRYSVALQSVGNGSGLLQRVLPAAEHHLLPQIVAGANEAFTDAMAATFWITIATGTAALLLTLPLRNSELRHDKPAGSGKGS